MPPAPRLGGPPGRARGSGAGAAARGTDARRRGPPLRRGRRRGARGRDRPRSCPRGTSGGALRGGCARPRRTAQRTPRAPAPPQPQCLHQESCGCRGVAGLESRPPLDPETVEPVHVDRVGRDADDVARPPREENGVRERLAKLRDEDLHHLRCRRRSVVAPQVADEAVGGNGAVGVEQEPREERPLLPVPEENRRGAVDDLERPEQPELHTVVYRLIRDRVNPTAYRTTTAPQPARSNLPCEAGHARRNPKERARWERRSRASATASTPRCCSRRWTQ